VAHRGRLKANKAVQVGKVRTIEVNVESRAYREGHRKQNDSSEDPESNTGRAIVSHSDKCLVKLRREPSNEIASIQHAVCQDQRAR
jgi:hypothetical protein